MIPSNNFEYRIRATLGRLASGCNDIRVKSTVESNRISFLEDRKWASDCAYDYKGTGKKRECTNNRENSNKF